LFPFILKIARRTIAPDSRRIMVKPDASMALSPNANRHSTEFAANAITYLMHSKRHDEAPSKGALCSESPSRGS